jgi:DNA repair protein RecN (Recombination protein N)
LVFFTLLLSITINNYTLVDALEIEFSQGMTAITGETGAGKSLILDALSMALGDRADTGTIRQGKERAQIAASFDISTINTAKQWLHEHDYAEGNECILRRTYNLEGRSRGYINGQPCTMQQLQQLGEFLVDLHGQHEHQSLLRRNTHRNLLDEFTGSHLLAQQVEQCFQKWHRTSKQLHNLAERSDELEARKELLEFQASELQALNLAPDYLKSLEDEQQNLANAEQIIFDSQQLLAICDQQETFNLRDGFNQCLSILNQLKHKPEALVEAEQLLQAGLIQVDEAIHSIEQHIDLFEINPQRLQQIEDELGIIFQLTRKHKVESHQLAEKLNEIETELQALTAGDQSLEALQQQLDKLASEYTSFAKELSQTRAQGAIQMSAQINQQLQQLSMEGAELVVQLTAVEENQFKSYGLEDIELVISTNPGQPHKPLAKIASGGELSRVSLAIQVVAATNSSIPTLVFDEVDVGIGGSTADTVGKLLYQLGKQGQVISVTHQPQVAAHAHQHYLVNKITDNAHAESSIVKMNKSQRIEELARMLGGAKVTDQTLSHANELFELASS